MVGSVWVHHVWYWQHVRPWVDSPRHRRMLVLQGLVGIGLVGVLLAGLIAAELMTTGYPVFWNRLLLITPLWPLLFATALHMAMLIGSRVAGVPPLGGSNLLCFHCTVGLLFGIALGIIAGVPEANALLSSVPGQFLSTTLLGFALGVATAVDSGEHWRWHWTAIFVLILLGGAITQGLPLSSLIWLPIGCTVIYLGSRWATRQVSEETTRQQLTSASSNYGETS